MTSKNIFLLLAFLLQCQFSFGQKEFQITYGKDKNESFNQVIATYDNGFIAIGTTESAGAGKKDILVVKTDSMGNVIWSKTYGGKNIDVGTSIDKSSDGNYYIAGQSASFGMQYTDIIVIKINPKGAIVWSKLYPLSNSEYANAIVNNPDGGCTIVGETIKYIGKGKDADIMVLKINNDGSVAWSKKYGGKDSDYAYSIAITKDNGYIIGGETKSFAAGEQDMYLLKLAPNGQLEWGKGYGTPDADFGKSAIQTADGNYILAGSSTNSKSRDADILITKVATNGNVLWSKIYGGNNQEFVSSLQLLKDDAFAVSGITNSFELTNENAFVEVFTSGGMPKWGKAYGSDSSDVANHVFLNKTNELIIAGSSKSFGVKGEDAYLIKTFTNHTLEDCNATDITTLVTKNIKITTTDGCTAEDLNIRVLDITPMVTDVQLDTKSQCIPDEDY